MVSTVLSVSCLLFFTHGAPPPPQCSAISMDLAPVLIAYSFNFRSIVDIALYIRWPHNIVRKSDH